MIVVPRKLDALLWRRVGKRVYAGDTLVRVCSTKREAYRMVFQHNRALKG